MPFSDSQHPFFFGKWGAIAPNAPSVPTPCACMCCVSSHIYSFSIKMWVIYHWNNFNGKNIRRQISTLFEWIKAVRSLIQISI